MLEYRNFLENEKDINYNVERMLGVKMNFNIDDYRFLIPIFKDEIFIKNILDIIVNITGNFGDIRLKYLMLGDFLFSFLGSTPKGDDNLLFTINKEDFFINIRFRASINVFAEYDYHSYVKLHQKLVVALRGNNIIHKNTIRSKDSDNWKVFTKYRIHSDFVNDFSHPLLFSNYPYTLVSILNTMCYSSSFRNIWKAKRKKIEMEDFKLDYISTNTISSTPIKISSKYYNSCIDLFKKEEKFLLDDTGFSNTDTYLKDVKVLMSNSSKKNNDVNDLKNSIIIEKYQKILYIHMINTLIINWNIMDKIIYMPHFMDNRGREYAWGMLSYTFCKSLRMLYEFDIKKPIINKDDSVFFNKIITYKYKLDKFNIQLTDVKSYYMLILLYEIGKNFIKKGSIFIKFEDVIDMGINIYLDKNDLKELDIEDALYVRKMIINIDYLIIDSDLFDDNVIIYKDATASGLQNYGILLGYKLDKIKYLNLDGEDWCDTYMYLIKTYLKTEDNRLFNRKYWKNTIMTIPYNSVWYSCWIKFLVMLEKDGIIYKDMSTKEKNSLKETHKLFYDSIKYSIKDEFYEKNINDEILFKYNKVIVVSVSEYKINYKQYRDKYTSKVLMFEYDEKKTKSSAEANNMHYLDAKLVKNVRKKFDVFAIHDCFGIRLTELHLLIDYVNKYYSNILGIPSYSIHILK